MVKSVVTGKHPETNEEVIHEIEAEAICTVTVKSKGEDSVEVSSSIMGSMNAALTEAMVNSLLETCKEILKGVDPIIAALILAKGLELNKEGEKDVMAGESSEPERPSEQ